MIHKATQELKFKDPLYQRNRTAASTAHLMWGAYHYGDASDGVAEAEFFLETIGDTRGLLLVLDFEHNLVGPSMGLNEARAFVKHVKEVTGRWPGFYCGHYYKELLGTNADPVITNCWFWLAQYVPTPIWQATWDRWTMWQYTDGASGPKPYEVPGIGLCDRNIFNGTEQELSDFWKGQLAAS